MITPTRRKKKEYRRKCYCCGQPFVTRSHRGRWCSAACKQKEYRRRVMVRK